METVTLSVAGFTERAIRDALLVAQQPYWWRQWHDQDFLPEDYPAGDRERAIDRARRQVALAVEALNEIRPPQNISITVEGRPRSASLISVGHCRIHVHHNAVPYQYALFTHTVDPDDRHLKGNSRYFPVLREHDNFHRGSWEPVAGDDSPDRTLTAVCIAPAEKPDIFQICRRIKPGFHDPHPEAF
jgi:hypothetical protein